MNRPMLIRFEQTGDEPLIAELTAQAFAGLPYSDQSEHAIIARLRAAGALAVSLVAAEADAILGHVAFSAVTINTMECGWFGLGPVSVRPDRQNQGLGGALIRRGLEELGMRSAQGCVVLGNPGYYRRFGFAHCPGLRYPVAHADHFMALPLSAGTVPAGRVDYHPAFGE